MICGLIIFQIMLVSQSALGQYEQQFGVYCPNCNRSKSVIYIAVKAYKLLCVSSIHFNKLHSA